MPSPVVVISAFADQTRVKEALNHGAAYLLEKPFSTSDLKRVLERLWENAVLLQLANVEHHARHGGLKLADSDLL